jgi:hypothetical protein
MLAPEELVSLRGAARASLSGSCDITRKTRVRQPNGSWKDGTATIASNIPCRKVPTGQTPEERAVMQNTALTSRGVATFILDGGQEVYKDDVITYQGKQYGVIGVYTRTEGEYTRAVVYDDSAAPVVTP